MPVVDVEIVGEIAGDRGQLTLALADALGRVFGSKPAGTWVRLRSLPASDYAENDSAHPLGREAVFVKVLKRSLPQGEALKQEAMAVAEGVAHITGRKREHTHVLFEAAAGRIAFGGVVVE